MFGLAKVKLLIENQEYDVEIVENTLFESVQEAVNEILEIKRENRALYDVLGDFVGHVVDNMVKPDYPISRVVDGLSKKVEKGKIVYKTERDNMVEIVLLSEDEIAYINATHQQELELAYITSKNPLLIAKALFFSDVFGGW